ncbi:MAG: type II secretion system major pseudopilin GspG [Candidatus Nitronauta litoralis]|uniref:Type II secretion system core protein G n=1 Tax=Candidatus Nitronauta litoralis TaxID=2705533 RepID=A0A7T0G1G6_9BACT|nr:MAG: type II secretion system major pseudopilin GspG [Candidatus Nitronauta litoralis]
MQTPVIQKIPASNKTAPSIRGERGFSLLELIVVITMIAIMVSLVAPKFLGYVDQAKQTDAQAQIELLGQALDLYRLEKGKYPSTSDGLAAIKGHLKKDLPKDPWGNDYRYEYPGQHGEYDLMSYGADNAEGGEGNDMDIVSWKGMDKGEDS